MKLVRKLMDWGLYLSFGLVRACHRRHFEWQIVTRFESDGHFHTCLTFALEGCLLAAWYQQWGGRVIFDISLDGSSYLYWYFYWCFVKVSVGVLLILSILTVKILLWHHQTNFCQNFISFILFTTFQHFLLAINSESPISCPEIVCLWQKITFSSLKKLNRKENGNRTTFANL